MHTEQYDSRHNFGTTVCDQCLKVSIFLSNQKKQQLFKLLSISVLKHYIPIVYSRPSTVSTFVRLKTIRHTKFHYNLK